MAGINFAQWSARDLKTGQFESFEYPSQGLQLLTDQLSRQDGARVLDLGPPLGANVDFLAQFHCRVRIENLFEELKSSGDKPISEILPLTERFDVVLLWDLLNHLTKDQGQQLLTHIRAYTNEDSALLCHLSTMSQIPAEPILFRVRQNGIIAGERQSQESKKGSGLTEHDLSKLLPGWRLSRSLQLRNSLREHLWRAQQKH